MRPASLAAPLAAPLCTPTLVSERLVLRLVEARDARALFSLYSDRKVMRYWNHEAWTAVAQADSAIQAARLEYARGASIHYVIEQRASHAVIGSCALYDFARSEEQGCSAMLGYLLAPGQWGQGYLTEAMLQFLDHAFLDRGFDLVRAQVHPENAASAGLLAKLGFVPERGDRPRWTVAGVDCRARSFALHSASWIAGCGDGAAHAAREAAGVREIRES